MKLAISVWLWRMRLLLFVSLASLKPFGFKLSLGICILSQGGLWVTVSAIVAWPGCLAVLRACFGLHTIRIVFERVWGLACHLIYLPFYILVGRVHSDYIGVVGSLKIRWVFVHRCRRLVVEALRCFVFLWFKEITLFNEMLLSWQICFSERLPRCC